MNLKAFGMKNRSGHAAACMPTRTVHDFANSPHGHSMLGANLVSYRLRAVLHVAKRFRAEFIQQRLVR